MKKFSKFTAVILTALLLCGLVVPFAASAAESGNQLNVTGETYNTSVDFEDGQVGRWSNYRGQYARLVVREAANGNKYYSFTSETSKTDTPTANIQLGWKGCNGYTATSGDNGTTIDCDYVTIDFELATDRYVYVDADGISHTVDENGDPITSIDQIPDGCDYRLAYSTSGSYYTLRGLKVADGKWSEQFQPFCFQIQRDTDGSWYVFNHSFKNTTKKIPLSGELGVFDHFTFVLKNTYHDDGKLDTCYLYQFVNGELMNQTTLSGATFSDVRLEKLTLTEAKYVPGKSDTFAMAYDNLAVNRYTKGSPLSAGLDAFFADDSYKTTPFYQCSDVVYGYTYASPNGYVSVDGLKGSITAYVNELLANVKNESVVETTFDLLNYELPEGVEKLTVKTLGNAKFKLGAASAENFVAVRGAGGVYTIRRGTDDDYITLKWTYISEGVPTLLKSQKIAFDVVPAFTLDGVENAAGFDVSDKSDWKFDVDGNASNFGPNYNPAVNLYDAESIRAITWLEVLLIREELGGELMVYTGDGSEITANLSANETVIDNSDIEDNLLQSNDSTDISEQNASKNELSADVDISEEIPAINENETPVVEENSKTPENNDGALLQSSEPKQNTAATLSQSFDSGVEAPAVESVSETNSSAWLGFIISILVVAATVAMISKHRSET